MRNIPFSPPDISEGEIKKVGEALRSGWITTGPMTKGLEKRVAEYCNTNRAVCLNSQTACAEMTLRLLGVGPGDEVITTAYTYTATASVICHTGATPVLVDTKKDSYEIDIEKAAGLINEKTKVIIPVDIAGVPCDYDKIFEMVESKKSLFKPANDVQKAFGRVIVMADGAHSFGAVYKGRKAGSAADFTNFSFHAVKNLTTAEGGAVAWRDVDGIDNDWLYNQYMLLSLHGQSKDALAKTKPGAWEYDIVAPNYKCNMTDVVAAIGQVQLDRYDSLLEKRKKYIMMYDEALKDMDVQVLDHYNDVHLSSGHLYLLRLLGKDCDYRNEFIVKMAEQGIATNVHYKPLPMLTAYKNLGFDIKDFPNAFNMYQNEVTLPLNTKMTEEDVLYVAEKFREIRKGN